MTTPPVPEGLIFRSSFDLRPEILLPVIDTPSVINSVDVIVSMNALAHSVPHAPKLYELSALGSMVCAVKVPVSVPPVFNKLRLADPVTVPVTSPVTSP